MLADGSFIMVPILPKMARQCTFNSYFENKKTTTTTATELAITCKFLD